MSICFLKNLGRLRLDRSKRARWIRRSHRGQSARLQLAANHAGRRRRKWDLGGSRRSPQANAYHVRSGSRRYDCARWPSRGWNWKESSYEIQRKSYLCKFAQHLVLTLYFTQLFPPNFPVRFFFASSWNFPLIILVP